MLANKELAPDAAVSKYFVRRLALSGAIPTVKCGCKRLINLDVLIEYLQSPQSEALPDENNIQSVHGIRRIM